MTLQTEEIIASVRRWLEGFVIKLNLCPFAAQAVVNNQLRFAVTEATTMEQLIEALAAEFEQLNTNSDLETTLLIHPCVLQDFLDYNQFLDIADALLIDLGLEGVYQIASFHPDYQFAGTSKDDAENYSNRAPYPLLHILREESLEQRIAAYPDVDQIPVLNIEKMNAIGGEKLQAILEGCVDNPHAVQD